MKKRKQIWTKFHFLRDLRGFPGSKVWKCFAFFTNQQTHHQRQRAGRQCSQFRSEGDFVGGVVFCVGFCWDQMFYVRLLLVSSNQNITRIRNHTGFLVDSHHSWEKKGLFLHKFSIFVCKYISFCPWKPSWPQDPKAQSFSSWSGPSSANSKHDHGKIWNTNPTWYLPATTRLGNGWEISWIPTTFLCKELESSNWNNHLNIHWMGFHEVPGYSSGTFSKKPTILWRNHIPQRCGFGWICFRGKLLRPDCFLQRDVKHVPKSALKTQTLHF